MSERYDRSSDAPRGHAGPPSDADGVDGPDRGALTRRSFIQGAFALSAAGIVVGCGSSSGSHTGSSAARTGSQSGALGGPVPRTPSRGGTLRIGYPGNGTSETYDPALANTPVDSLHVFSVFDPLLRAGPNHNYTPGLAVGWQPSRDAMSWEIRLRSGVRWHDGKPFTADDVIYNLRRMGSPSHLGHFAVTQVRLNDLKKLSDTLVRVPLMVPIADLRAYFGYVNASCMVQDGAKDFRKPIGTGAYKLVSFTPGQQSILAPNRDYWDSPRPYPDSLHLLSIDDDNARLTGLQSGQLDICGLMNFTQARAGGGNQYKVLVGYGGPSANFNMRVDQAPFNDVRVRQAMKLLMNRPAMIDAVLSGFGELLNDLPGKGFPHYDSSLPQRTQDIAKAKSLLKAAGQSDIRFTLQTADAGLGQLQAAEAYIQQLHAAGISGAQLKVQPVGSYYNPALLFTKMTFAQNIWAIGSLNSFYSQALVKGGPLDETHWSSPAFDKLFFRAQAATDPAKAQQLWNQLQSIQWNQGGYIFWAEAHNVDGVTPKVAGLGGPGVGWAYPTGDQRVWDWGLTG